MKERKNLYASIVGWGMFLAGAFALTSCADEEIDNGLQSTGKSIGFSASYSRTTWEPDQTRSAQSKKTPTLRCESTDGEFSVDVTVEDGIRSSVSEQVQSRGTQITEKGDWQYKVGAYYYFDESVKDESGEKMDFFAENADGGLSITSNSDNYTTNYYWPPVGTMKFFAVAPADVAGTPSEDGSTFAIPVLDNIAAPTLTYTIPSDVSEQKDIMVAQSTVECNANNGAVGLQFEHLLAGVKFKMGQMLATQVNSITISGVKGGEVKFNYKDGKWTPTCGSENISYVLSLGATLEDGTVETNGKLANTLNLDEGADITGNDNNSMLLVAPQLLSNATVTVSYTELLVLESNQPKTTEITINLPEHTWEAGKTYAYTLSIKSGLNITIPRPDDQDAHYVMVEMDYDLTEVSDDITDLTASIEYINNTASTDIKPTLKMKTALTELQSAGYWTETQYEVVENEDGTTSYNNPINIRGDETLSFDSSNKSGTFVIFLPENNGTTDREVVLRITGKYNNTTLTIGSGSFKQYCPCWSEDGSIGVERFEEKDTNGNILTHPWGFKWDRTAEYKFSGINIFLPYIFQNQFTYTGSYYTIEEQNYVIYQYMYVTIDYTKLNNITGATDSDGLNNTKALFNSTDTDGGIAELENFCKSYTSLINDKFSLEKESGSTEIPEDYAAYEALKRNKFIEGVRSKDGQEEIFPMIFEEDMQWFLPSTTEALKLRETKLNSNDIEVNSIDALEGTYWSSNRHVAQSETETDDNTKAFTITYTDGDCTITAADRMVKNKIRAVRKATTSE